MRLFFLSLLLSLFGPLEASFTVSPMIVEFNAQGGEAKTQVVEVKNTGDKPLRLNLYRKDFEMELSGHESELEPGTHPKSISPHLNASPEGIIDLEAGDQQLIRLTFTPPEDHEGTLWGKFFIQEMSKPDPIEQKSPTQTMRLFIKQRWEVRLHGTTAMGEIEKEGDIVDMSLQQNEEGERRILVHVQNPGKYLLYCKGTLSLKNEGGDSVFEAPMGNEGQFAVYPGLTREVGALLPKELEKGRYLALAIVDTGDDELVAGELEVEIE